MPAAAIGQTDLHSQPASNQELLGQHGTEDALHVNAIFHQQPFEVVDRVMQQMKKAGRLQPLLELDNEFRLDQIHHVLIADLEQHHPCIRIHRIHRIVFVALDDATCGFGVNAMNWKLVQGPFDLRQIS